MPLLVEPGVLLPLSVGSVGRRPLPGGKISKKTIEAVDKGGGKVDLIITLHDILDCQYHTTKFSYDNMGAHLNFVYLPFKDITSSIEVKLDDILNDFQQNGGQVRHFAEPRVPDGKVGGAGV